MSTKTIQGQLWSVQPQYWSRNFEPYFIPLYKKALEKVQLKDTESLLDAGCGAGMFSSMAISTGAHVVGVDAAPALLEIARKRNPRNNFLEEDLESLPFADDSFDVVAGFNSFQYAGSFPNALKEAKRTLRKDGRIVIAIWDKPEMSDGTNVLKAISGLIPPPPPGTPGPFALSEDGKIEDILRELGLTLESRTVVPCQFLYPSLADGVKSYMGTGPAAKAMMHTDKSTVEETIKKAIMPYHMVDTFYYMVNRFILFVAKK